MNATPHTRQVTRNAWLAMKRTFTDLGLLMGIIALFMTLLNLFYGWGFRVTPVFEHTLDGIRTFAHWATDVLFYRWIEMMVNGVGGAAATLLKPLLGPVTFKFSVPEWTKDLALISIALLRVFEAAYQVVPRSEREIAENATTPAQYDQIQRAQGSVLGPIHATLHWINARYWDATDWIENVLSFVPRRLWKIKRVPFLRRFIIEVIGGLTFWGMIRLAGYLINLTMTVGISAPILDARRRVFLYFAICGSASLLGAITFFAWQGYLVAPAAQV